MSTLFPVVTETPLKHPPLTEVVCQVRFPPILRIASEEPAEFQELIRGRFPDLEKAQPVQIQLSAPGNPGASEVEPRPPLFRFIHHEEQLTVALTVNFYALSTLRYTHWGDFLDSLRFVNDAVQQTYRLPHASRIGLRYINRLTLANTGAATREELLALVRPELSAALRGPIWDQVSDMISVLSFSASPAQLNLRYGFEQAGDDGPAWLLDFDCFEEDRLPLGDLLERCERYHAVIYNAFRWCVPDDTLLRFQRGGQ